jgi:hypothetical protein
MTAPRSGPAWSRQDVPEILCSHLAVARATPTVDGPREERLPSILVFELGLFEKFGQTDVSEKCDAAVERRGLGRSSLPTKRLLCDPSHQRRQPRPSSINSAPRAGAGPASARRLVRILLGGLSNGRSGIR